VTPRNPLETLGGRKFLIALVGMLCITLLAMEGKEASAFGAIALIVGGFTAGNAYSKGRGAPSPKEDPADG
jgi:hypothetical protein